MNILDFIPVNDLASDLARLDAWKRAAGDVPVEVWARQVLDAAAQTVNLQDKIQARLERHRRETEQP